MLDSVSEFWDSTSIMMNGKIATTRTRKDIEGTGEDLEKLFFEITEGKNNNGNNDAPQSDKNSIGSERP
jgi:ABC-2 type transport system ATP-binding protein